MYVQIIMKPNEDVALIEQNMKQNKTKRKKW